MLETSIVIFRFVQFTGAMILFGSSLFFLCVVTAEQRLVGTAWLKPLLLSAAVAILAATLLGLVAQTGVLAGSLTEAIKPETLRAVLADMSFGRSAAVRILASGATLAVILLWRQSRRLWFAGALGGGAICVSMAWMGHGAATQGVLGSVHLVADMLHLLAAAGWIGALVAFSIMLAQRSDTPGSQRVLASSLARFSGIGTGLVALIVATGLVNSYVLVGLDHLPGLWTTRYGQLLVLKLLLFAVMVGFAARNRLLLTPALERSLRSGEPPALAIAALRRSVFAETLAAGAVLALVAWLGTLAPIRDL